MARPVQFSSGMNSNQTRPVPGNPVVSIRQHGYWPCCTGRGPRGTVRPVVGPHTPFCGGRRISLPLTYILKMIEPETCRVISEARMAGPEEARAALKLLGPTNFQPVLVSRAVVEFLPRA